MCGLPRRAPPPQPQARQHATTTPPPNRSPTSRGPLRDTSPHLFSRANALRAHPGGGVLFVTVLASLDLAALELSRGLLGRGASKPHIHTLWRTTSAPGIGHQSGPRQRVNFPSAARAPMCAPIGNRSSWCDVPASACFRAALACSRAGSSRAAARHLLLVCAKSTFGPHKSRSNTRTYSLTSHSMRRKSRGGGEAKPLNAGQGRATTRQVQ